jgi:hypothetical protein
LAWTIDDDDCGAISAMNGGQGKPKYSEETCPNAALATTDRTRFELVSNPGRRGGKPATNYLELLATLLWKLITSICRHANVFITEGCPNTVDKHAVLFIPFQEVLFKTVSSLRLKWYTYRCGKSRFLQTDEV